MIGVFYSPESNAGLFKVFKFVFLGLSLVQFTRILVQTQSELEKLIKYLLVNSTATCYFVLFDFYRSGMVAFRYQAFGEVVPIPLSMLGATTLLIAGLLYFQRKMGIVNFLLVAFPATGVLVIAASKGPVIALGLTVLLISPMILRKLKIWKLAIIILSLMALTKIPFISLALETLVRRFVRAGYDMSTSIRLDSYDKAMRAFLESPYLGIGTGGNYPDYPHNVILEILSENGLLLLIVFAVLVGGLGLNYIKGMMTKPGDYLFWVTMSLLLISIISLMFSFTYVDHKYLFLSIGMLISTRNFEFVLEPQNDTKNSSNRKRIKLIW